MAIRPAFHGTVPIGRPTARHRDETAHVTGHLRNDAMIETIAYIVLGTIAAAYLLAMIVGMIAIWPWGLVGLAVVAAVGALFIKALRDRLTNPEDDHYTRNVDK